VALGLGLAAQVNFSASVKAGLPWEFEPLQASAHLLPGDVARAQYRVKNLSDQTLTGKADENTAPEALAGHLRFYQCFCMLQLTLAPGEEQTLTVGLALTEPLPAGQNVLEVHYDFYPIESFPFSPGTR
jgi:cytochrome c oxidase assembly protein subunit 11